MASALHPHCSHLCHCSGRTIRLQLHPTSPVPTISTLPTPAPNAHSPLPSQYPQHRLLPRANDHRNVPHNRPMPTPLQFHHLHRLPLRANTPRDIPHHSTNPPTLIPQYRHLQRPPPSLHTNVPRSTSHTRCAGRSPAILTSADSSRPRLATTTTSAHSLPPARTCPLQRPRHPRHLLRRRRSQPRPRPGPTTPTQTAAATRWRPADHLRQHHLPPLPT